MEPLTPPTPDPASPDPQGGAGGASPLIGTRRSGRASLADLKLLQRALKAGWDLPDEAKKLAPERMVLILEKGKSARGWIAAAKTLDAMERTTLAGIDTALRVRAQGELEERITALEQQANPTRGKP
jgi:hypothetical protein